MLLPILGLSGFWPRTHSGYELILGLGQIFGMKFEFLKKFENFFLGGDVFDNGGDSEFDNCTSG